MSFLKKNIFLHLYVIAGLVLITLNLSGQHYRQITDTCSISAFVKKNAVLFLGKPYKAGTLDNGLEENLVWKTDSFDCVTFVETVISLYLLENNPGRPITKEAILTKLRYRNGIIDGYGSRIHYFLEWIKQNEESGLIKIINSGSGSMSYQKKIHFMSAHKNLYPHLSDNVTLKKIRDAETVLSGYELCWIPKNKIKASFSEICTGDIIAITTDIDGMDVVHTGFAFRIGEEVHLLHASQKEKKVVVSELALDAYMANNKKQSGIIICRMNEIDSFCKSK